MLAGPTLELDALSDLLLLPFRDDTFDAALNVVTLEHVTDPAQVIAELYRCLKPGGRLLLITPMEWEEHQQPHDYFRYTQFGLEHLTRSAGFVDIRIEAVGGFFRLLVPTIDELGTVLPGHFGNSAGDCFRAACAYPAIPRYTRQEAKFHARSYMFRTKALILSRCSAFGGTHCCRPIFRSERAAVHTSRSRFRSEADRFSGTSQAAGATS